MIPLNLIQGSAEIDRPVVMWKTTPHSTDDLY